MSLWVCFNWKKLTLSRHILLALSMASVVTLSQPEASGEECQRISHWRLLIDIIVFVTHTMSDAFEMTSTFKFTMQRLMPTPTFMNPTFSTAIPAVPSSKSSSSVLMTEGPTANPWWCLCWSLVHLLSCLSWFCPDLPWKTKINGRDNISQWCVLLTYRWEKHFLFVWTALLSLLHSAKKSVEVSKLFFPKRARIHILLSSR